MNERVVLSFQVKINFCNWYKFLEKLDKSILELRSLFTTWKKTEIKFHDQETSRKDVQRY